jgi:hypothetical protein
MRHLDNRPRALHANDPGAPQNSREPREVALPERTLKLSRRSEVFPRHLDSEVAGADGNRFSGRGR